MDRKRFIATGMSAAGSLFAAVRLGRVAAQNINNASAGNGGVVTASAGDDAVVIIDASGGDDNVAIIDTEDDRGGNNTPDAFLS